MRTGAIERSAASFWHPLNASTTQAQVDLLANRRLNLLVLDRGHGLNDERRDAIAICVPGARLVPVPGGSVQASGRTLVGTGSLSFVECGGEADGDGGAAEGAVLDGDLTMVGEDDGSHDGEPETGAAVGV